MKYFVYILLLGNKQLYTGFTEDIPRRFAEHQNGGVASTAKRQPVELIHYEAYKLKTDAMRRECFLKATEGKKLLRKQLRDVLAMREVI